MSVQNRHIITTGVNFEFLQRSFNNHSLSGVGLEGASRTGKSWDICNFICHYVTTFEGRNINVGRDHLTTLKKTIYKTLKQVWRLWGLPMNHFNKSATPIHYNNNVITFIGINDDIMAAHGLESDLLVLNEAMNIDKETFDQLEQRTTEFFIMDYNPSASESYIFDLEARKDYEIFKTTIFDNLKYAPKNSIKKILSYAHPDEKDDFHIAQKAGYTEDEWLRFKADNSENGTADLFMWQVYGLGLRAVSEDRIYNNLARYTDEEEPEGYDWIMYGGDLGFDDPNCFVQVKKNGRNLYIKELFYESGLTNRELVEAIYNTGYYQEQSVWDSAEPKTIRELRVGYEIDGQHMYINAIPAVKGPDSVHHGTQFLKSFRLLIHIDSSNVWTDFTNYKYKKMKDGSFARTSKGHKVPERTFKHSPDAVRYAATRFM